jgi:putative transposase
VYHVLNRANARMTIFKKPEDYEAFLRVLEAAVERTQTRLLAYCVMPNHWHLVVWPAEEKRCQKRKGVRNEWHCRLRRQDLRQGIDGHLA